MPNPRPSPMSCQTCAARRDGVCTDLTAEEMGRINRFKSGERRVAAGVDIVVPGESSRAIYNLVSGWAFRYGLLEDGRRQIVDFILPGAVIGVQTLDGAKATYGVQALTDTALCVVRHEDLASFSSEVPGIALRLAWLIARDRSLAYDHLTSVGRQSASQRVAHLILELYVRYRVQWPGHRIEKMQMPLTQEHIADATGLTGVHVNRVLRELREDGVLEFHYKRLRVLDPDKLVETAGTDPHLLAHWTRRAGSLDSLLHGADEGEAPLAAEPMSKKRPAAARSGAGASASLAR